MSARTSVAARAFAAAVLLSASDQTHGHGTHTWAALWQQYLGQLLESSPP
jgi:hypothetical protein